MPSDSPPELRGELLDDFYAEFDELLTNARNGLVQLEASAGKQRPDIASIEALFRNLHTLKGISAIAGLRSGEELAHAMEDLLRSVKSGRAELTLAMIDGLLLATQRLGQICAAHKLGRSLPPIQDILDRLQAFMPEASGKREPPSSSETALPPAADPIMAARERGLHLFLVRFAPSKALDRRGINVNSVRARLAVIGEILSATPQIKGKGSIVFEFVTGLREIPGDFDPWEKDAIHFESLSPAPAPEVLADEPAAPAVETGYAESLSLTPSHIVRVDLTQLDELMRITGEMVIHRSRLEERIADSGQDSLKEINRALTKSLREMRRVLSRVRLVSVAEIFSRMPFVVRDLARDSDKKVRVLLEGRQTEIDKYLVERLKEPLLHLVRNAFAHGIESTDEREKSGKPAEAVIELRAKSQGERVIIQVRDDGRGIDSAKVIARAHALGLRVPEKVDSAALLEILCSAGFSTREDADRAAGRGVGMAVVESTVRQLGGTLSVESKPGAGTEFTLKLPLTLSITDALIVTAGNQTCAMPQGALDEIIQIERRELRTVRETTVIPYRNGLLPVKRLRTLFSLPPETGELLTILVLSVERGAMGLIVDRVLAQREIVIRPLADILLKVPGVSGATELGDGKPILILDPLAITQGVIRPPDDLDNLTTILTETRAQ
ncbi:MAG TPA: chemotaxis protein CheA [Lacunisphaera sp.]|jgi:two-component system chemotaxis sensor kinase CheA